MPRTVKLIKQEHTASEKRDETMKKDRTWNILSDIPGILNSQGIRYFGDYVEAVK